MNARRSCKRSSLPRCRRGPQDTVRADFLASIGLQDPDMLSPGARLPSAVKLIMDAVFLLYLRSFDIDPTGDATREVTANICFEAKRRGAG